ncbi:hypothetical protein BO70DRAFT_152184 [Aspergillus heteromorphus CBS 117.55]|uniref:Uncharacterized protein n=1 Tax=Aspergillus heteromorphus CBS 117.55 TaxID=1448321 RepID=A0A317V314_9EURO|nr:uncharacterized protein BO70DRAFT_152184 [Aspergillus heteromorphus CBS 117.55]PWY68664.1 hypothetical protein BO70DRAFT_152184 [Aspergillus heteromorphus CBS 117.55]
MPAQKRKASSIEEQTSSTQAATRGRPWKYKITPDIDMGISIPELPENAAAKIKAQQEAQQKKSREDAVKYTDVTSIFEDARVLGTRFQTCFEEMQHQNTACIDYVLDLRHRTASLESYALTLEKNAQALASHVKGLEDQVQRLEGHSEGLEGLVKRLESRVGALESRLDGQERQVEFVDPSLVSNETLWRLDMVPGCYSEDPSCLLPGSN